MWGSGTTPSLAPRPSLPRQRENYCAVEGRALRQGYNYTLVFHSFLFPSPGSGTLIFLVSWSGWGTHTHVHLCAINSMSHVILALIEGATVEPPNNEGHWVGHFFSLLLYREIFSSLIFWRSSKLKYRTLPSISWMLLYQHLVSVASVLFKKLWEVYTSRKLREVLQEVC